MTNQEIFKHNQDLGITLDFPTNPEQKRNYNAMVIATNNEVTGKFDSAKDFVSPESKQKYNAEAKGSGSAADPRERFMATQQPDAPKTDTIDPRERFMEKMS